MNLDEYIAAHTTQEDEYLHRLYRATQQFLLRPRMASGPLQGQFLRMLTQMIGAHISPARGWRVRPIRRAST